MGMWDGLACPPLEDYAFNFFDTSTCTLEDSLFEDDWLDNPLLEIEEPEDMIATICFNEDQELDEMVAACLANPPTPPSHLLDDFPHLPAMFTVSNQITKARVNYHPRRCGNHGKGKDLKTAIQAMDLNEEQIKAFFGQTDEVLENRDKKKRKIMDFYGSQPMQRKDMTRLADTNQLDVGYKRKADDNCQPMQRKDIDHTNQCVVGKKRKADYYSKPMQQKNRTVLDQTNQTAVLENKRIADYESRFEASRQMLHEAYKQSGEAKQQIHIQVIDFQKPEKQQPGSKDKAKGKPSLRQKLMAMGTRKSNKKFPPYKMLSSCN